MSIFRSLWGKIGTCLLLTSCTLDANFIDLPLKDEKYYAEYPPVAVSFSKASDFITKSSVNGKHEISVTIDKVSPADIYIRYKLIDVFTSATNPMDYDLKDGILKVPAGSLEGKIEYNYQGTSVGSKSIQLALTEVIGYPSWIKQQIFKRLVFDSTVDDDYKHVSPGSIFSCGISKLGVLKCWGANDKGQIPGASTVGTATPAIVDSGVKYDFVSVYGNRACGITDSGALRCWGENKPIEDIDVGTSYISISVADIHACGITEVHELKCWGKNSKAIMGAGVSESLEYPPTVLDAPTEYRKVVAGANHACAITQDKKLKCWGANSQKQIQFNTQSYIPILEIQDGTDEFSDVALGISHTCSLNQLGQAKCWGANTYMQMGNGLDEETLMDRSEVETTERFSSLVAGALHTCGLRADDKKILCWGFNQYGNLGNNVTSNSKVPVESQLNDVVSVGSGGNTTCAINSLGVLFCWGEDTSGQSGQGMMAQSATPLKIDSGIKYSFVDAGIFYHSCGITDQGTLKCWGNNGNGQIGDRTTFTKSFPVEVDRGTKYQFVNTGFYHTCGITLEGELRCWGANGSIFRLGDGLTPSRPLPKPVKSDLKFKKVSAAYAHSCALSEQRKVYCWGENVNGALGDGTSENRSVPTEVDSTDLYQDVQVNYYTSCALTLAGALHCWGNNVLSPTHIDPSNEYQSLTRGRSRFCGRTKAGEDRCWTSTNMQSSVLSQPVEIAGPKSHIQSGYIHYCLLNENQDVGCWGSNTLGQLGDATITSTTVVSSVNLQSKTKMLSVGYEQNCAISTAGDLRCWGSDRLSQLGSGRLTLSPAPVSF